MKDLQIVAIVPLCCNGLEETMTRPRTIEEIDNLKWELHFENTKVFIRNKRWYKLTSGRCIFLDDEDMCKKYEQRPQICRDHNPPDCEFYGSIFDLQFESPEDFARFIVKEKRRKKRAKAAKSAKETRKNA